jgi:hypothetical protein
MIDLFTSLQSRSRRTMRQRDAGARPPNEVETTIRILTRCRIPHVMPRMRPAALSIVSALAILAVAPPASAQAGKLGPGVRAEVRRAGRSTVFVKLRQPTLPRSATLDERCQRVAALRRGVAAAMPDGDVRIVHELEAIAALTARVTPEGLAALEAHPEVARVDSMATGSGALGRNLPLIHGDVVHRRGVRGEEVTVAVLDSGVEVAHPDIAGRVIDQECFCFPSCCPDGSAQQSGAGSALTTQPHGLHVTGIVASAGIVSAPGTAPAARIVSVKVLDELNRGFLSDWIAGLDFVITQRPDVQAINMSLVSDITYEGFCDQPEDPNDLNSFIVSFAEAFEILRQRNVLIFAASGNIGETQRISAPACVEKATAVGGVDPAGNLWRGGNISVAIDLLAPAVAIESDGVGGSLLTLTGTSMATAFATGSAALMLSMNPALSADELEDVLKGTGIPIPDRRPPLTFARIDERAAMNEVWRLTQPLLGGGSADTDCLVSWDFGDASTRQRPVAGLICEDGDPTCDHDAAPGRCGIDVGICLNRADGRVRRCSTSSAIESYALGKPQSSGDEFDAANAAAITSALPLAPIADEVCTEPVRLTIPVGSRSVRLAARAADGRRDDDKLRLVCSASDD